MNDDAARGQDWLRRNPAQVQELLRQSNLIYGGLIGIGVVIQPFLPAGTLDLSARICVVAFSVAIPLLAALLVVNRQEVFRRRMSRSVLAQTAQVIAQLSAFTGVAAGFWHIFWIAGVAVLGAGLLGVAVHSAGYARLEQDQQPTPALRGTRRRGVVGPWPAAAPGDRLVSSVAQTTRFG